MRATDSLIHLVPVLLLSSVYHAVVVCGRNLSTVDLGYARYQGIVNLKTQNIEFLGLRYAAPPVGMFLFHLFSTFGVSFVDIRMIRATSLEGTTSSSAHK